MELSNRLLAIADMVSDGCIMADIGTDHGYIPIYLIKNGKCSKAYAMDINPGPLQRAQEHIKQEHLEEKIELRLSDGMSLLRPGEANCAVIAGMGGALIIHILESAMDTAVSLDELILSPQSEIAKVREWLIRHTFTFVDEDMIVEEGKYYPIMKVRFTQNKMPQIMNREQLRFGPVLLKKQHPVLKQYIDFEIACALKIQNALKNQVSASANQRKETVMSEMAFLERVKHEVYGI